jgi:hypothetical protein
MSSQKDSKKQLTMAKDREVIPAIQNELFYSNTPGWLYIVLPSSTPAREKLVP